MKPGYVYIMSSEGLGGDVFKIGRTTQHPNRRAAGLSSGGALHRYNVEFAVYVSDCVWAEREAHQALEEYRTRARREFFNVPLSQAIVALKRIANQAEPVCGPEQKECADDRWVDRLLERAYTPPMKVRRMHYQAAADEYLKGEDRELSRFEEQDIKQLVDARLRQSFMFLAIELLKARLRTHEKEHELRSALTPQMRLL
jgi:hypothetical protein